MATVATRDRSTASESPRLAVGLTVAVVVGLAVGALTAYGQGWLSDSTSSLANSAGPWSLAAFVVARYNRRLLPAVVAAVLVLACCEFGYVIANRIRDVPSATSTVVFWLTAAVLAGPPLGVAAAWSTRRDLRRQLGFGVVGGVLIGEGWYGWTTVADTTDWRYWAVELVISVAIVVAVAWRSRRALDATVVVATAALTALVVFSTARLA